MKWLDRLRAWWKADVPPNEPSHEHRWINASAHGTPQREFCIDCDLWREEMA